MPFAAEYRKLAPNPDGFPALAAKLIALEKQPMASEAEVRALKIAAREERKGAAGVGCRQLDGRAAIL